MAAQEMGLKTSWQQPVTRVAWSKDIVASRACPVRWLVGRGGVVQVGGVVREETGLAEHLERWRGRVVEP